MGKLSIYTDGASKGNPGPAGIGVVIAADDGTVIREIAEYVGEQTNNAAEYLALIRGLREALDLRAKEIEISVDSQLMARQLTGVYKVKSPNLKSLHEEAIGLLRRLPRARISHVCRGFNKRADELANEGIERHRRAESGEPGSPTPKRAAKRKSKAQGELEL